VRGKARENDMRVILPLPGHPGLDAVEFSLLPS
jgi:hypothetical protein